MRWMTRFQQMYIVMFFKFSYLMIIASRGMGKTQIMAAALCAYCILYPGTKVVIAAGVRDQMTNFVKKIVEEFYPNSQNLRNEIDNFQATHQNCFVKFKNGSIIRGVSAKESARSNRANIVICDEFVKIQQYIINTVIRRFKSAERRPDFFNLPKYTDKDSILKSEDWEHIEKEPNKEIYISSAYYKWHYSWEKFQTFFKSMVRGESYCVCGFPYQLPVSEGYYPIEQIREEMQEDDFDEVAFSMEMESLFFGESSNAFFSFKDLNNQRKILQPLYPKPYYDILGENKIKYREKVNGEIRLLSCDIATQGGAKNDATAITLLQMVPSPSGQFYRDIVYMETIEGGHGQDQAVRIRQLYDDLDVDYVIVDTNGVGMSIFDQLVQDQVDQVFGSANAVFLLKCGVLEVGFDATGDHQAGVVKVGVGVDPLLAGLLVELDLLTGLPDRLVLCFGDRLHDEGIGEGRDLDFRLGRADLGFHKEVLQFTHCFLPRFQNQNWVKGVRMSKSSKVKSTSSSRGSSLSPSSFPRTTESRLQSIRRTDCFPAEDSWSSFSITMSK